jgi:O-antigen/teichoic acid export membrane protein
VTIVRKNFFSNIIGNSWIALLNFVSIPIYIKYLGVEAYGLIGFYSVLQAIFLILDLGFGATVTRELARTNELIPEESTTGTLVKTLEFIYWIIGVLIGMVIFFSANLIVEKFIKSSLPHDLLLNCVRSMGVMIVFRWPVSFYMGGLIGIQRQLEFNILQCAIETFKVLGVIFIFEFIKQDILYFFLWQIVLAIVFITILHSLLWKHLHFENTTLDLRSLEKVWVFSAGVSGITIVSILLSQMDKIVLTRMLSLQTFSYYMIAYTAASSLSRLSSPIVQAYYPQFINATTECDEKRISGLYHKSTQLMTVLIVPAALIVSFFSYDLLLFWTHSVDTAKAAQGILSILVLGSACNSIITIPYHIQLAYGWTKLSIYQNIISLIVLIPLLIFLTYKFQAVGAAYIWLILNLGYIIISQHFMHKRYLIYEKSKWYWRDIMLPSISALLVILVGRYFFGFILSSGGKIIFLIFLFVLSSFAAVLFTTFSLKAVLPSKTI